MRHILILAAIGAAILSAACDGTHDCAIDPGANDGGTANEGGSGEGGSAEVAQDLSAYCDVWCDCEPCPEAQYQECQADMATLQTDGLMYGCDQQVTALQLCLDGGVCTNGSYEVQCNGSMWDLATCIDQAEPDSDDVCDLAAEICGAGSGGSEEECTGAAECAATCIVDYGCDVETDQQLQDCIEACAM